MGTVRAVAAAPGEVIYTKEDQFDGCHVTTDIEDLLDDDQKNNVVCPDPDNPEGSGINDANRVSVCHPDGTVTEYLHLMRDRIPGNVSAGSKVQCGQVVGTLGSSGKSSGPHLHFSVLVPASRAAHMGHANGQTKKIGGRDYVYLDPYHLSAPKSLWTHQEWNYAANFDNSIAVPSLEHPNGHPVTLACAHLVPPHDGHPGPTAACLHPRHPNGDQVTIAGITQTVPCTHPAHDNGHPTTVPCLHPPVPAHPNGHQGPSSPCTHFGFTQVSISALTLPGPQCDDF